MEGVVRRSTLFQSFRFLCSTTLAAKLFKQIEHSLADGVALAFGRFIQHRSGAVVSCRALVVQTEARKSRQSGSSQQKLETFTLVTFCHAPTRRRCVDSSFLSASCHHSNRTLSILTLYLDIGCCISALEPSNICCSMAIVAAATTMEKDTSSAP